MPTDKYRWIFLIFPGLILSVSISAQTFKAQDFYQLADGNEWRYVAPPAWKGDYVSRMESGSEMPIGGRNYPSVLHFDATGAAKILVDVKGKGIYFFGENFADKTFVRFDAPVLWFPEKLKIGDEQSVRQNFTRTFADGKTARGTFSLKQKIAAVEAIKTSAGDFKKTLRIESETFWDLGDRRKAKTQNVYHYARGVGVVKASARFIIVNGEGKETINRLVETDLKSYQIQK